ncbi:N-alpha-acetyltransferase 30 [Aricia agestis]|uniref:N-alpha-acetyltransferase 30 n=1 Tax=Aricia agestis TaxID=91739 RepID=UPI001C206583|nr:N-alpha-acetyltransferase 30 [Aricia agestis]
MNDFVEENLNNMKCSQRDVTSKNKSKKAKDSSDAPDEIKLKEESLSAALVNTLNINNISSKLTNGTSEHSNDIQETNEKNSIAQDAAPSEVSKDVNIIHNNVINAKEHNNEQLDISLQTAGEVQNDIDIISYESELQMPEIMRLIQKDLSEPYSIYTYRYFIHNWPKLCFLATDQGKCIGAIVCKLDMHRNAVKRGYIAMLAVDAKYRNRKIGSKLVQKAIQAMIDDNADEVVLETEITNKPALKLYENLGFVRDKRLFRYYLNGVDALRLKLWLR